MKKLAFSLFVLLFSTFAHASDSPVAVYWGFFDPPTVAHREIIIQAVDNLKFEQLIIVVNKNKSKKVFLSAFDRINLIKNMLPDSVLDKITILNQDDDNPIDYFSLKKNIQQPLHIIAGEDSYKAWLKNNDYKSISKYDKIYVIPRSTLALKTAKKFGNVEFLPWSNKFYAVSSSQIKDSKSLSEVKEHLPENVWKFIENKTAKLNNR